MKKGREIRSRRSSCRRNRRLQIDCVMLSRKFSHPRMRERFMKIIVRTAVAVCAAIFACGGAAAQYTDRAAIDDLGGPKAFADRRAALAKELKTGRAILFAKEDEPEDSHYREDNDFYYFTGLQDPGAVVVIEAETGKTTLFEPVMSPRRVQFMGANAIALSEDQQKELGYEAVFPITGIDAFLGSVLQGQPGSDVWVGLSFPDQTVLARTENASGVGARDGNPYSGNPPTEMRQAQLLRERFPMANFKDATPAIDRMRNIKSAKEIGVLRRNGKISAEGDRDAIAHAHPGMYQYEMEAQ